jgi:hypothetical protein
MHRLKVYLLLLLIISLKLPSLGQGTLNLTPIATVPTSARTGEKPQSKIWEFDGKWWAVFPDSSGTHIWRLDKGNEWINVMTISKSTKSKADCKKVNDTTHILLFKGKNSELVSVKYNSSHSGYELLTSKVTSTPISFDKSAEIATIDIDGENVMWLAYEENLNIFVRHSSFPYTNWSNPISVESEVKPDDICAIISMPGKIGVLWSNQKTKFFGFKTHIDGDPVSAWSADEKPASQSSLNVGDGMADDHLNMALANNGTLYCAVKTSYDTAGYTEIALLVRKPDGKWDNLYNIDDKGTRPIVIIDEQREKVQVIYTEKNAGGNIYYRESDLSEISFGKKRKLIEGSNYNNASSSKDNYKSNIVVIASTQTATEVAGVLAKSSPDQE